MDWDEVCIAFVITAGLCFGVSQMRGCNRDDNQRAVQRSHERALVVAECVKAGQDPLKCKQLEQP